ncbi:MAG: hypothetical protein ACOYBY_19405 [Dermatophilaceae bacterium]
MTGSHGTSEDFQPISSNGETDALTRHTSQPKPPGVLNSSTTRTGKAQ